MNAINMEYENTLPFALGADKSDPLRNFREKFFIPRINGREAIYLTGNSLGLQPKTVKDYVCQELDDWARLGVEGHFHANNPWLTYHEIFPKQLSAIIGCREEEVVVMNQLTVNLHLLMVSFYQPDKRRYKIICEGKAFPSDQYAFESHVRFHGFDPDDAIIEINPRDGEHTLRTEDILDIIHAHKDDAALVLLGGVNYYTGQLFDMEAITKAAHAIGVYAGFDLAHAVGNVELKMHDWNVDFATWCTYKYLNSGPGAVSGIYIHEHHVKNKNIPRFGGWWGHNKAERFKMEKGFDPIPTAEGWQLSNAPVLSMAAHKASLDIFEEAGFNNLLLKSRSLSGYLHYILNEINSKQKEKLIEIITPADPAARGCQVSMLMHRNGKEIFKELSRQGVISDWREPNVIRVAPVPLYNTFEDVWRTGNMIETILS